MPTKLLLVDPEELQHLIAKLSLDDAQKDDIKGRWLKYVIWWDSRANHAKTNYRFMRCAIIIAGALIPAFVSIRELEVWKQYGWIFAVLSIIASLIVAICAGLDSFFNYGSIWREKRAAAELLKSEGHSFFQLAGQYKKTRSHKEALPDFAENVESIIRQEIRDYIVAVRPIDDRGKTGQPEIQ
jgi:hypothetical protein